MRKIMKVYDEATVKRVLRHATYFLENESTTRKTAEHSGESKKVVYEDLEKKLPHIDSDLYQKVRKILDNNKKERCSRGGKATKGISKKRVS